MSGKLFAFNVSKKSESVGEKARDQWIGDRTARAVCRVCYCSGGQGYGLDTCLDGPNNNWYCDVYGSTGYYICDSY